MGDANKIRYFDNVGICEMCMRGEGDECHEPGCLLIRSRCPDIPIGETLVWAGMECDTPPETREEAIRQIDKRLLKIIEWRYFLPDGIKPSEDDVMVALESAEAQLLSAEFPATPFTRNQAMGGKVSKSPRRNTKGTDDG